MIPCSVAVIVGGFFGSSGVPAGQSRRLPAGAASAGPTERRTRQGPLPLGTGIRTAFVPKRQKKTPQTITNRGVFLCFSLCMSLLMLMLTRKGMLGVT